MKSFRVIYFNLKKYLIYLKQGTKLLRMNIYKWNTCAAITRISQSPIQLDNVHESEICCKPQLKSKHKWWVLLNSNRSRGGGEELSKIEFISFILWEKYSFLTKKDPSFKTVPFKLRMMAYFAAQASFLSLPTVSFQALLLPSFLRMCFLDYSPEVFFSFSFYKA